MQSTGFKERKTEFIFIYNFNNMEWLSYRNTLVLKFELTTLDHTRSHKLQSVNSQKSALTQAASFIDLEFSILDLTVQPL